MAKKPAHKKPTAKPQPEPAQIKAIERLLDGRDYAEAVRRIRAPLARSSDHGGLHRSLGVALQGAEDPQVPAVAAFAWAGRRPNSLPAQEVLLHFAKARGHVMLAERTARQVRALGGETPGYPVDPALLSTIDVDDRERLAQVKALPARFDPVGSIRSALRSLVQRARALRKPRA